LSLWPVGRVTQVMQEGPGFLTFPAKGGKRTYEKKDEQKKGKIRKTYREGNKKGKISNYTYICRLRRGFNKKLEKVRGA